LIWDAVTEHELNTQEDIRPRLRDAQKALSEKGKQILENYELDVQGRLWSVDQQDVSKGK